MLILKNIELPHLSVINIFRKKFNKNTGNIFILFQFQTICTSLSNFEDELVNQKKTLF